MTVHGAKGLEAPIVILADTTTPPEGAASAAPARRCRLPTRRPARRPRWSGRARKDDDVGPMAARARAALERGARTNTGGCSMSAMTRAAERLVVCGAEGDEQACRRAAGTSSCATRSSRLSIEERRRRRRQGLALPQDPSAAVTTRGDSRAPPRRSTCPPGCTRNAAATEAAPRAITPSDAATMSRPLAPARRRPSAQGACARHARASAAAVAAGHRAGAPRRRRREDYLARAGRICARRANADDRARRCWRCSTIRASPRCSRPAAAPKCRSSAASRRRRPVASPARSTGSWSPQTKC